MIKRTLYFGNPVYLSIKLDQLNIYKPNDDRLEPITIPIEDVGIVMLDHQQITITHEVIRKLQDNKVAIISCDKSHMPQGLMLPLQGNSVQSETQRFQINASEPLKKNLWQQTVIAKIRNQKSLLLIKNKNYKRLAVLEKRVKSGDSMNVEGQAAAYYWKTLFDNFIRDRDGGPPNHFLNYGYAVLRAMIARALVSSGLLPTIGIFHKNKYNAYCLADDIMEPFRPFVDCLVFDHLLSQKEVNYILTMGDKEQLLTLPLIDVLYNKRKSPLMVGMAQTTRSLVDCFIGKRKKIIYPSFVGNVQSI